MQVLGSRRGTSERTQVLLTITLLSSIGQVCGNAFAFHCSEGRLLSVPYSLSPMRQLVPGGNTGMS